MIDKTRKIAKLISVIALREQECNSDVSKNCKEEVLTKIYNNVKKERLRSLKRNLYVAVSSVAAVVVLGVVSMLSYNKSDGEAGMSYENIIAATVVSYTDKIIIFNDDFNMELPANATIENSINGDIIVDGLKINIKTASKYRQIVVPEGEIAKVILSDGSKVTVNSNSRLIYNTEIDSLKRDVYVIGEALFDIYKNVNRPFAVKTKHFDVNVTGTKFIVKSDSCQTSSVALISGSVNVNIEGSEKHVTMSPNNILVLDGNQLKVEVIDNMSYYTSWVDRLIEFKMDDLGHVVNYISNFYNIDVVVPDKYKSIKITGKLDLKEDVNKVLKVVSILAGLEVEQNNNIYTLKQ